MGNNSKVVLAALVAIVVMFIFMPTQFVTPAGSYGLEYRFIWQLGLGQGRAYGPNIPILTVQIASVLAVAALQIVANRKK